MALAEALGRRMRICFLFFCAAFALQATNYFVIVAGLGGAPEYDTQFAKWAQDLDHQLNTGGDAHVITLSGPSATKQQVEQSLNKISEQSSASDSVALFLIGHGSFDGVDYKINLPGPDMTGAELAKALNRIPGKRQLVVNMTSCSGASLAALARKDRVVISATKSGTEKNAPVFARYWVDALHDPSADADKNGSISALEAFRYAERKTAAYFEAEKLLATEHAVITDTASATGVRDPKPENGQGLIAASFILIRARGEGAKVLTPDKQRLVSKKEDLEAKIDKLKYEKAAMDEGEYRQQLTGLLLELARTQAEIDK
jgi:hypothetical protein